MNSPGFLKGHYERDKELEGHTEGQLFIDFMVWVFENGIARRLSAEELDKLQAKGGYVGKRADTPFIGISCVAPRHAQWRIYALNPNPPMEDSEQKEAQQRQSPIRGSSHPNPSEAGSEEANPYQERDVDTYEHIVTKISALREIQKGEPVEEHTHQEAEES